MCLSDFQTLVPYTTTKTFINGLWLLDSNPIRCLASTVVSMARELRCSAQSRPLRSEQETLARIHAGAARLARHVPVAIRGKLNDLNSNKKGQMVRRSDDECGSRAWSSPRRTRPEYNNIYHFHHWMIVYHWGGLMELAEGRQELTRRLRCHFLMLKTKPRFKTRERGRISRIHNNDGVPAAEKEGRGVAPCMPRSFDLRDHNDGRVHEDASTMIRSMPSVCLGTCGGECSRYYNADNDALRFGFPSSTVDFRCVMINLVIGALSVEKKWPRENGDK